MKFPIDGLVLYAPLWHPELSGSPFKSKDLNAHSCVVTQAAWGITGRTFNGNGDFISLPVTAILNPTDVTYWFCLYPHSVIGAKYFYGLYESATAKARHCSTNDAKLSFSCGTDASNYRGYMTDGNVVTINSWLFIAITQVATAAPLFYVGSPTTVVALVASSLIGSAGAATLPDLGPTSIARPGDYASGYFDGVIGDVGQENKVLTLAELEHIRQATAGRR